ncbi:MAG TPA: SIMPL domain-containing protein [Sphingomonas sp.]
MAITAGLAAAGPARADPPAPAGTRLAIAATGEVTRQPDVATLGAGVVTQAASAAAALADNARRMAAATAALRRAGIADKDIRTATLSLQPRYRYADNQPPAITGYQASNQLSVTFHDIAKAGAILDTLVGQGVNQISGPDFAVEHPEAALDEARANAIHIAQARAQLYAKAAGLSVRRIVSISESGTDMPQPPRPMVMMMARAKSADTELAPGDQKLAVTVQVSFELQ